MYYILKKNVLIRFKKNIQLTKLNSLRRIRNICINNDLCMPRRDFDMTY